nr:hypothetical protein [Paenibacillus alvei]
MAWIAECQGTSFDDGGCTEHEEDGDPPGSPRKTRITTRILFSSRECKTKETLYFKKDRVSQQSGNLLRFSFFLLRMRAMWSDFGSGRNYVTIQKIELNEDDYPVPHGK